MTLKEFLTRVSELEKRVSESFDNVRIIEHLEAFFQEFLGKKSQLNELLKHIKDFSPEEKKEVGPQIQQLKNKINQDFLVKRNVLETEALNEKLKEDWIDVTKSEPFSVGNLHPISKIQRRVEQIFSSMGFEIADGPEVETEWNNFDALNVPQTHPARDMQDTFWISKDSENSHENSVLRTQTSNIQIRKMIEHGAPIRIIAPGRVFRNEELDATHDATFYQVEGLLVDENITLGHLKGILEKMLSELFEKEIKIRIRPGYFPFVEPGLEVDIWFELPGKEGKWLEFMGAGMVHPSVLRNCGVDSKKYGGFAFGFGLTRLVMMKYEIEDIRLLSSQKKEFLEQF
ncbi:phenylalanine--tRNA ligase subunit alpha [Candidatus Gracilibacteria bacterium]|nr:phenylalanine--tRNA ligase subunit alpha [Candidatus Gracilibacteria bacterium]